MLLAEIYCYHQNNLCQLPTFELLLKKMLKALHYLCQLAVHQYTSGNWKSSHHMFLIHPSRHGPDFHRPQSQITIDSLDFHLRQSQNCLRGYNTEYLIDYFSISDKEVISVAVSCGFDTWFAVRPVMDYTISHFTWSILGYLSDPTRSSQP